MNIATMMKDNDIELEWLFTLSKLNDQEGLMYFEPIVETIDDSEVTNLNPKCFIIDGAKFIYDEDMDDKIIVNAVDKIVTLTRIDGIQINIDTKKVKGFPFKIVQFKDIPISQKDIPKDFVKVE